MLLRISEYRYCWSQRRVSVLSPISVSFIFFSPYSLATFSEIFLEHMAHKLLCHGSPSKYDMNCFCSHSVWSWVLIYMLHHFLPSRISAVPVFLEWDSTWLHEALWQFLFFLFTALHLRNTGTLSWWNNTSFFHWNYKLSVSFPHSFYIQMSL